MVSASFEHSRPFGYWDVLFLETFISWRLTSHCPVSKESAFIFLPDLEKGDHFIVDRISHRFLELERNDIVFFLIPPEMKENGFENKFKFAYGRVLGLPGEKIDFSEKNTVSIRKTTLQEQETLQGQDLNLAMHANCFRNKIMYVSEDHYLLLVVGDTNCNDSAHAYSAWNVPKKNIDNRFLFRYWPIKI